MRLPDISKKHNTGNGKALKAFAQDVPTILIQRAIPSLLVALVSLMPRLGEAQCEWMVQRGPDPRITSALCFLDNLHGWVGRSPQGSDGILRTTNGGKDWQTVYFGFSIGAVGSISFIDTLHGWCTVPSLTKLYKTTDGGLTWAELYRAPDYRLFLGIIQFVDSLHGFSVGRDTTSNATRTWRTTDGGLTWSSMALPNADALSYLKFVDTLHGWIEGLRIYATTDAGITWFEQMYDSGTVGGLGGVDFIDIKRGWSCSAGYGWIIHTTDGGDNWSNQYFIDHPFGISFHGLSFVDSLNGWVFGTTFYQGDLSEVIYRTTNGGYAWFQESIGLSRSLGSGVAIDSCHAWAVAIGDGSILELGQTTDVSEPQLTVPEAIVLSQNYPNPFNPTTTVTYQIPHRAHVRLNVVDQLGRDVLTLVDAINEAGSHSVHFDATTLSSGVYYVVLATPTFHQVKKSMLIK